MFPSPPMEGLGQSTKSYNSLYGKSTDNSSIRIKFSNFKIYVYVVTTQNYFSDVH